MEHRGRGRFTLVAAEDDHVLGVCAAVDGLFGEPERGTYELLGWVPDGAGVHGWVGDRVWLVPDGGDAWLLEDARAPGLHPASGSLVLTGLDDDEGPPEGHRGRVRVHDERRWLGSCREFARVLPPERERPALVLRGLAPGDRLRAALAKGTRRALNLDETVLEIRDDRGEPLTDRTLWVEVRAWRPSAHGTDLIDLELDGVYFPPVPEHVRPVWERWFAGPPDVPNAWTGLGTRLRKAGLTPATPGKRPAAVSDRGRARSSWG
ncbi:hypothetical protein [Actinomadura rifamycini]|uniref:hypothetical protein n=1 Tax=Actinomadura rifamycini TaxID=31962 RepID=UPI001B7FAD3E|nr:hypothetical protein [Actinomadura rifamycini]